MFFVMNLVVVCLIGLTLSYEDCGEDGTGHLKVSSATSSIPILAGENHKIGHLLLSINPESNDLTIKYELKSGNHWLLSDINLWISNEPLTYPQTDSGNPIICNFPYKIKDIYSSSTSLTIPLSDISSDFINSDLMCNYCNTKTPLYLIAEAKVYKLNGQSKQIKVETAFTEGNEIIKIGSWSKLSNISINTICEEEVTYKCERAFAYGENSGTCFLDMDLNNNGERDFNSWGWTLGEFTMANIPSGTFKIYAGAKVCDINQGTHVANLVMEKNNGKLDFDISLLGNNNFKIKSTHLYIGNNKLPKDHNNQFTVAPNEYPNIADKIYSRSYSFNNIENSGPFYFISHSMICGDWSS